METEKTKEVMNAIGYIRVSTDEQAREGVCLDNQAKRYPHTVGSTI